MKYRFIAAENTSYPIAPLCAFMGVSCSGYYAWKSRLASNRQREDMVMLVHIKERFEASGRAYGLSYNIS